MFQESGAAQTKKQISLVVNNLLKMKNQSGFASSDQVSECEPFYVHTKCYPSVQGNLFDILPTETRNSGLENVKKKKHSMLASLIETHALMRNSTPESSITAATFAG